MGNQASTGTISATLDEMQSKPMDLITQEECCHTLMDLSHSKSANRDAIGNNQRGALLIISAMKNFPREIGLNELACGVIMNLSHHNASNQNVIAVEGGIEAVIDALKTNLAEVTLCQLGLGALWNLGFSNPDNQIKTCQAGAPDVIVSCLMRHQGDEEVCGNACGALAVLSENVQNQTLIPLTGTIPNIIKCMTLHASAPKVVKNGCEALMNLAHDCPPNQNMIAESGGVEMVVMTMKSFKRDAKILEYATGALWNLSYRNRPNQDAIFLLGGIPMLVDTLLAYATEPSVYENACGALVNVSDNNPANQEKISLNNGIETIMAAVKKCPVEQIALQENNCGLLMNLSHHHVSLKDRIGAAGGCEWLVERIKSAPNSNRVVANASGALWNLANNHPTNASKIMLAQGPSLIIGAVSRDPMGGQIDICENACGLVACLAGISVGGELNKRLLMGAGAVEMAVNCLRHHGDVEAVCEAAVHALWCLNEEKGSSSAKDRMEKAKAKEALKTVRKNFEGNSDIQKYTLDLLGKEECEGPFEKAIEQAKVAMRSNNFTEAIDCYSKAIDIDDSNSICFYNRCTSYFVAGDTARALADLEKYMVLRNSEISVNDYITKAMMLQYLNRLAEANDAYQKGLAKFPLNLPLLIGQKQLETLIATNAKLNKLSKEKDVLSGELKLMAQENDSMAETVQNMLRQAQEQKEKDEKERAAAAEAAAAAAAAASTAQASKGGWF